MMFALVSKKGGPLDSRSHTFLFNLGRFLRRRNRFPDDVSEEAPRRRDLKGGRGEGWRLLVWWRKCLVCSCEHFLKIAFRGRVGLRIANLSTSVQFLLTVVPGPCSFVTSGSGTPNRLRAERMLQPLALTYLLR